MFLVALVNSMSPESSGTTFSSGSSGPISLAPFWAFSATVCHWKFTNFYSKLVSTNLFSMLLGSNLLGVFISSFRVLARGVNPISQENSPICINYLLSKFVFYPFRLSSAKILAHTSCPSSCWYMLWQRQQSIRVLALLYLISISHSQLGSMWFNPSYWSAVKEVQGQGWGDKPWEGAGTCCLVR